MREYLLVLFVAMATTFLLTGVARQIALRYGAVAKVRARDVHKVPIPYFGGVSILGGLIAGFAVASSLPFLGNSLQVAHDARAILIGGVVICAVGVVDDLYELDAITKLAGQVLAVGVMVVQGIQLYWLPLPGGVISPPPAQLAVLTAGILLVSCNAVNFVDGLDGLAAGRDRDRRDRVLHLLVPAERRAEPRPGDHLDPDHGRPGRCLPRLPAAQLLPRQGLHGRLRRPADRPDAGRVDDQPDRPDGPERGPVRGRRLQPAARRCSRWSSRSRSSPSPRWT